MQMQLKNLKRDDCDHDKHEYQTKTSRKTRTGKSQNNDHDRYTHDNGGNNHRILHSLQTSHRNLELIEGDDDNDESTNNIQRY